MLEADLVADLEIVNVVAHDAGGLVVVHEAGVPPRGIALDEELKFPQHCIIGDGCVPGQ